MPLITYTGTSTNATSAANNLKPIYEKAAKEQFNRSVKAFKYANSNKQKMYGSNYNFAIKSLPGGNFTIATETGEFAAPNHRDVALGQVSVRGTHGVTLSITKLQMTRSKDPEAAFLDNFKEATKDALYIMQRQYNIEFYGDGAAARCLISSYAQPTATIDTTYAPFNTRWLAVNDDIEYFPNDTSGSAHATTGTVSFVGSESTFKTSADDTTPIGSNKYVYIKGVRTAGTVREIRGMGAILSTSSAYMGITPGTTAGGDSWKAVIDSTGGDVDLSYPIGVMQDIMVNTGSRPTVGLMSPEMLTPMNELNMGSVRYESKEVGAVGLGKPKLYLPHPMSGGEITLEFDQDLYCPPGRLYIFDPENLKLLVQMDTQYLDSEGNPVQRIPRTQIFEGQLVNATEMFTDMRNAFGLCSGLTYSQRTWAH